MRAFVITAAVVLAMIAIGVGALALSGSASGAELAVYTTYGLRFTYPSDWHAVHTDLNWSSGHNVDTLSTEPINPDPCSSTSTASYVSGSCGPGVAHLGPGGVFVQVDGVGIPGSLPGGSPTSVGGRPAWTFAPWTWCQLHLDASSGFITYVSTAVPGNYVVFSICERGPGLSVLDAQVTDLLDSVRILPVR